MTCLTRSSANGTQGLLECDESGCTFKALQIAGTKVPNPGSHWADCVRHQKVDAKEKLMRKIEEAIDEYVLEVGHKLATKIVDEIVKEKL